MSDNKQEPARGEQSSRRRAIKTISAAGAAVLAPGWLTGQSAAEPPSTVSTPPRDFGPGAPPVTYPDPDLITVDPAFNGLRIGNTPIQRLWTGALWSEGPAWSSQGRYLVWSDIPNDRQLRWLEDDGRVTVFRSPSNNSNGNTFDFQGRQVSCEHLLRRVVRYEHDGTVTVLADAYDGKPLNSPNDVVPHPDGSYWFTDPPFGGQLYEGVPDAPGGPSNAQGAAAPARRPGGRRRRRAARAADERVSRRAGRPRDDRGRRRSSCPGRRTASRSRPTTRGSTSSAAATCIAGDVADNGRVSGVKQFVDSTIDGVSCRTDGIRVDVYGNVWCSSNAGRSVGYSGVTVWNRRRHPARPHPLAGGLRERRVRRPEAQPAVHGREPVAVRGLRQHAGCGTRLSALRRRNRYAIESSWRSGRLWRDDGW